MNLVIRFVLVSESATGIDPAKKSGSGATWICADGPSHIGPSQIGGRYVKTETETTPSYKTCYVG